MKSKAARPDEQPKRFIRAFRSNNGTMLYLRHINLARYFLTSTSALVAGTDASAGERFKEMVVIRSGHMLAAEVGVSPYNVRVVGNDVEIEI